MPEIASAYMPIVPSAKGFGAALTAQTSGEVGKSGGLLGGVLGKTMLVGFAAVGVAAGIGKALYEVGQGFNEMTNTIIVGTGASGAALDGLVSSAENIGKSTPSSFADVGTAVADLNTRLGLTGAPLERLSKQMLNMSRVTKTDLGGNIEDLTRVFGDWGISVADQPAALDKVFYASQATGAGINDLAQSVVRMGAPLRQFGFSFEEGLAIFGKWEKEGVNAQTVMAGLKIGLGQFSKAGLEPKKALEDVQKAIMGAGSAGEANQIAIKAFGQRAGPDMAAAVLEGRFAIDDLVKGIKNSAGSIADADTRTRTFSESWQVFKNQVLLGLQPVAEKVFQGFTDFAASALPKVITGFKALSTFLAPFIAQVIGFFQGPGGSAISDFATRLGASFRTDVLPVLQQAADTFRNVILPAVTAFVSYVASALFPVFQQVATIITGQVLPILGALATFFYSKVLPAVVDIAAAVAQNLKPVFDQLVSTFRSQVLPTVSLLLAKFEQARPTLEKVALVALKVVGGVLKIAAAILGKVLPVLIRFVGFIISKGVPIIVSIVTAAAKVVGALIGFGKAVGNAAQDVAAFAKKVGEKVGDAVKFFKELPGKIKGFLAGLPGDLKRIGGQIIDGLKQGIENAAHKVLDAVQAIINKIPKKVREIMGISSPAKKMIPDGYNIMAGVAVGILKAGTKVAEATKQVIAKVRDQLRSVKSDFASLVEPIASAFTGNLFEADTASGFLSNLLSTKDQLKNLLGAFQTLTKAGLKPGFLYQLFQNGGAGLILDLAAQPDLAAQAGSAFSDVASLSDQLGTAVASATDKGQALENQTVRLEKKLEKLTNSVNQQADRIGKVINGAASNGRRRAA